MNVKTAVLAVLLLSTSALARGDTLAVSGTIPFEDGTTASVSFDWNTVTVQVFNLNITDGFALIPGSILIDPESNAIAFMGFTRPNETPTPFGFGRDYMQIDGELGPLTWIHPQPGPYGVQVFELCADVICMGFPDTVGVTMTVTEAPVGTPEPSTLKLAGGGVLLLLAGSWLGRKQ